MRSILPHLLPAKNIAGLLDLPEEWILSEASAGRLPHVDVSGQLMFDVDAVEESLVDRAREKKGAAK